jgi:hypothetical protein
LKTKGIEVKKGLAILAEGCYNRRKGSKQVHLTTEEARRRLASGKNLVNSLPTNGSHPPRASLVETKVLLLGRSERKKIPDLLKAKLGTLAHFENQHKLEEEFGVSQPVISKAKNGKVGGSDIQDRINMNLGLVRDKALEKLMSTLGLIDEAKLMDQDAKGLAHVASSLSRVVKDTAPAEIGSGDTKVQVVVYAPQQKDERKFEVIDV